MFCSCSIRMLATSSGNWMRGWRSISSLLIPAELEGRALELAMEVPGWRSKIKQHKLWWHQGWYPYNRYLLESLSKSYRSPNQVSAWWIALYYLSCNGDLSDNYPVFLLLPPRAWVKAQFPIFRRRTDLTQHSSTSSLWHCRVEDKSKALFDSSSSSANH